MKTPTSPPRGLALRDGQAHRTGANAEAVAFLEGISTLTSELGEKPMSIYHEALGALAEEALSRGDEAAL